MGGARRSARFLVRIKNNDQRTGFQAVTAKLASAFTAYKRRLAEKRIYCRRVGAENVAQQKDRGRGRRRLRRGGNGLWRAGAGGGAQGADGGKYQ